MSGKVEGDVGDTYDVDLDVSGRTLLGAVLSAWFWWAGVALMGVLTYVALFYRAESSSFVDEFIFITLLLICLGAGILVTLKRWDGFDLLEA